MSVEQLVAAHQAGMAFLRARISAIVAAQWHALGGRYDDTAQAAFVAQVVPFAVAAQRQAAVLTDAYLAQMTAQVLGGSNLPTGVAEAATTNAALRNGVTSETAYARPIVTVRTALSRGVPVAEALAQGLTRAQTIAQTDVILAQRAAMHLVSLTVESIVGYRRTLTGQSCGLCVTASTQRYRRGELMPIHDHCDCGVAPIYGTADPGRVVNGPHWQQVKGVLDGWDEERFGAKPASQQAALKELRFEVNEHGELGPVLSRKGQHWTGPDDIAA